MAELIVVKVHKDDCTAVDYALVEDYAARWPDFCRICMATGKVNRSGMILPCPKCMNGTPYHCPRCGTVPEAFGGEFWTTGVDCVFCGWRQGDAGAPVQDCNCPERVEIKETNAMKKEFKNKAEAQRGKRERLEALNKVQSAADDDS